MAANQASFSGTKEIYPESIFRSFVLRLLWRWYTQRLTSAGRWLLWPTLIVSAYGSASLSSLQAFTFFAYAAGLWAVALCCLLLWRPRVVFEAYHAERVCAGEVLPVAVVVRQQGSPAGATLSVVAHRLPREVDAAEEDGVTLPPLAAGETARAQLGLSCPRRGVYRLRGFRVETAFPLGLLRAHQVAEQERPLIVYPTFTPLARLTIPTGRRLQPGGVALASNIGDSFEYIGNREYRDGDNVRDIDWRATARLNKPIVREYREEYFLRTAVILDTHVATAEPETWVSLHRDSREVRDDLRAMWRRPRDAHRIYAARVTRYMRRVGLLRSPNIETSAKREDFERAVSVCASVSDYMARQEYLVDIFAAGPNLYHLTAGRSLAFLDQILDILACVEACPEEPFAALEPELMEHLASITSVICVFLDWSAARRAFVYRLREQGTGLKVIIVRDTPCTVDPGADSGPLGVIPVISKAAFDGGIEEL